MAIITGDFETAYDQQSYSLSKMSTVDYILDPRFQAIMLSLKVGAGPCEILIGKREIEQRLAEIDWARAAWLSHHTRFDGAILAWRFGIEPAMYLDTVSMARATTHWVIGRSSLKAVSDYLGLPPKGDEVVKASGKRLENFAPDELAAYADYCRRDNQNCYEIFQRMRPLFKNSELRVIDLIMRMYILPQVKLNPNALAEYLNEVQAQKEQALGQVAHIDKSVFSSNQKFAALLEQMGVEVPMKISPATGEEMPALARSDRGFKELLMDEAQPIEVQAVLSARINTKSTLEEKRTQRLLDLSLKDWPPAPNLVDAAGLDPDLLRAMDSHGLAGARGTGWAPVPIKYYGARTGRMSGDDGTNWLNFKRRARIREGIEAPPGYRIVHRDASQIEARMVAWLARCNKILDAFAAGRDVYAEFAASVYGVLLSQVDKLKRFVGKTGILGLGYGCGPAKFRHMLFLGNGGVSHNIDEEEARRIVYHYRREYPEIVWLWEEGEILLRQVMVRSRGAYRGMRPLPHSSRPVGDNSPLQATVRPRFDSLWLPNDLCISYPNLRYERQPASNQFEMTYDDPYGGATKIYGGKVTENISQALSRIVVTDSAVRLYDLTGYHPFLSTYDSLDYCVPESDVEWWDQELERQFKIRPAWAPDLPLASEGGWGKTLLAAENEDHPGYNQ